MSETLLIRAASHAHQPVYWWLFSRDDQLLFSGELPNAASLADLQQYATGNAVIALVPACDVVLRAVKLPGRLTRKTRHALPFLLEDELVEDPTRLHVAVLAHEAPTVHLAAVEHAVIQEWLRGFDAAGLSLTRMLPDVLALPLCDGGYRWSLGEQQLIRESRWQGLVLEEALIACLPAEKRLHGQTQEHPFPLRVSHLPPVSLLQGDYRPKRHSVNDLGLWRMPVYLLAACLALFLVISGLDKVMLSREESRLQAQMAGIYHQTFPGSKRVSDPWFAFKRKMEARNGHFIPLARALDAALPAAVQVKALQFDASEQALQAQLSQASAGALKAMEQRLPPDVHLRVIDAANVTLSYKPGRQKAARELLPRIDQMKQHLAQMQRQAAQQPAISAQNSEISDVIARTREKASLPASTLTPQGKAIELKDTAPLRFIALANWLQTLEFQYGIIADQVQLTDKGQGNVEVKRLLLSRPNRS
ncbi:type II secretion system protein GspL [Buttiauxella gaviniae]|uniref:Type II secretion system protein GspL n=1 Tax=Buttiauxella gaviniae TaxID=82990 RepID=A0ABV3NZ28_9ENTR